MTHRMTFPASALLATLLLLPAAGAAQVCPLPGQTGTCTMAAPLVPLLPATQPKFVYDLPVPVDYTPDTTTFPGFDYYEIAVAPVTHPAVAFPQPPGGAASVPAGKQWLGLVDPLTGLPLFTEVWGYGQVNMGGGPLGGAATYPAMNFRATKGRPVKVKWVNQLPDNHLFCKEPLNSDVPCAIDRTLMGATGLVNQFGSEQAPDNAMVIHLHGGEIPPDADGFAELWIGNTTTSGAYTRTAVPLLDTLGGQVPGATTNLDPPFHPAPNSGVPADAVYPTLNFDSALVTYTPGQLVRPTGNSIFYNYPMVQDAATIWYHDHALGKTRINVAAGPAGYFIVQDPAAEAALALPPRGDCSTAGVLGGLCYDIPVVFQDRSFNADGSINFPNGLGQAAPGVNPLTPGVNPTIHPQWVPEYFGDMAVVNGVIWPRLKVEPRPYRFRFLDGSNARCWSLSLKSPTALVLPLFQHIASDQGYLPAPVALNKFSMCPGERMEVVIDFSGQAPGTVFNLTNTADAPFPNGVSPVQVNSPFAFLNQVMQFQVVAANPAAPAPAPWVPPAALVAAPRLPTVGTDPVSGLPVVQRQMVLNEVLDPVTLAPLRVQIDGKAFEDPITEIPKRGSVEVWTIVNTTVDAHPMHLHLVKFQVVSRQKFNLSKFAAAINLAGLNANPPTPLNVVDVTPFLIGGPRAPNAEEVGWKDTAKVFPGELLRLVARWDGTWQDAPVLIADPANPAGPMIPDPAIPYFEPVTSGPYVWHCHIVDHEDNEMMRPVLVMP